MARTTILKRQLSYDEELDCYYVTEVEMRRTGKQSNLDSRGPHGGGRPEGGQTAEDEDLHPSAGNRRVQISSATAGANMGAAAIQTNTSC